RICRCVTIWQDYTLPILSWLEPMAIFPGRRLGPYEILTAIGAGSMGEVYQAHDTKLGPDAALEVLLESFARKFDSLRRSSWTLNLQILFSDLTAQKSGCR